MFSLSQSYTPETVSWCAAPFLYLLVFSPGPQSALDLLLSRQRAPRIVTFCSELDRALGGGVSTSAVTEFCGVPGVGKTQMGIQLAVDVQIPVSCGGLGGRAVYIDTEGADWMECLGTDLQLAWWRSNRKIKIFNGVDQFNCCSKWTCMAII